MENLKKYFFLLFFTLIYLYPGKYTATLYYLGNWVPSVIHYIGYMNRKCFGFFKYFCNACSINLNLRCMIFLWLKSKGNLQTVFESWNYIQEFFYQQHSFALPAYTWYNEIVTFFFVQTKCRKYKSQHVFFM